MADQHTTCNPEAGAWCGAADCTAHRTVTVQLTLAEAEHVHDALAFAKRTWDLQHPGVAHTSYRRNVSQAMSQVRNAYGRVLSNREPVQDPEDWYREQQRIDGIGEWIMDQLYDFDGTRDDAEALIVEEFSESDWYNEHDRKIIKRLLSVCLDEWEREGEPQRPSGRRGKR